MSKHEKLLERFLKIPADFTYEELRTFLRYYGYNEYTKGATSGSRVVFVREKDNRKLLLHRPHNPETVCKAALADIKDKLKEAGDIE